jgi:hypothetical protein
MKDERGHTPQLIDSAAKLLQCRACKELRKRGEKWKGPCLYPRAAKPDAGKAEG